MLPARQHAENERNVPHGGVRLENRDDRHEARGQQNGIVPVLDAERNEVEQQHVDLV